MKVTRFAEARPYETKGHFNMSALRLQGMEASPSKHCWVGLSYFLPGGGADSSASSTEKIYVVLEGEVSVITDEGETVLRAMDSCYLAGDERRSLINRSNSPASILVIIVNPSATP